MLQPLQLLAERPRRSLKKSLVDFRVHLDVLAKTEISATGRMQIPFIHPVLSWKFVGLIPDGVTGIFHRHNPSGRTMALGLTQPLTEMSTP
jgi:hypothetical protein